MRGLSTPRSKFGLTVLAGLMAVSPSVSTARPSEPALAWPVTVQTALGRLARVEFPLRRAAGELCPLQGTAIGAKFDYIGAYPTAQQTIVRKATGLGAGPQVIAVAPGSPAARAGLEVGYEIVSINAVPIPVLVQRGPQGLMPDFIEDAIAGTPDGTDVVIVAERAGMRKTFQISGEHLCAVRFYLKTGEGMRAYSDSRSVALGDGFVRFARNDDELALLAGHELAHIVSGDPETGNLGRRRAMEDRADLLGSALARCAGYDVMNGSGIWSRLDDRAWKRWGNAWTHRKPSERAARIRDYLNTSAGACPPQVPDLLVAP